MDIVSPSKWCNIYGASQQYTGSIYRAPGPARYWNYHIRVLVMPLDFTGTTRPGLGPILGTRTSSQLVLSRDPSVPRLLRTVQK